MGAHEQLVLIADFRAKSAIKGGGSLASQTLFPVWWAWLEVRRGKRVWCLWAIFRGICRNVGRSNEILAVT